MPGTPIKSDRTARFLELTSQTRAQDTLEELEQRLAHGESPFEVCEGWDVPYAKLMSWLNGDVVRMQRYLGALSMRAHAMGHEALEIADGGDAPLPESVPRDRLRVDTRLKLARSYAPALFGEKVQVEHRGVPVFTVICALEGGGPPLVSELEVKGEVVAPEPVPDGPIRALRDDGVI